MRRRAPWLALTALALLLLAAPGAAPTPAKEPLPELPYYVFVVPPEEENLDIVVFGESRAALVRFRVRINDRGFHTAWDEFIAHLYAYLDADGDRVLTTRETKGRWGQVLPDAFNTSGPRPAADLAAIDSEPKDGKVSLGELSRYVRQTLGFEGCGIQPGMGPDVKAQSAFAHLDRDGDGALGPAELATAEELISRLDADDDEMVTLAELRPNDNPFAGQFGMADSGGPAPVAPDSGPLVPLTTVDVRTRVARRLMARYDGRDSTAKDQRLSRSEFGLGEEAFRRADTDVSGAVDATELERFLQDPAPSLILDVRLGRAPGPVTTIALAGPEESPGPLASKVSKAPDDGLGFVLDLDGIEIRLGLNDVVRDFRKIFDMRFTEADANKDDALDRMESEKSRIFERIFDAADRNGDDKLARKELAAYFDLSVDATESRLMLTAADSGRNVFERLDADRDQRLCRRELRTAARRLKSLDRNGDGRVALDEVPRSYQLSAGRGPFFRRRGFAMETYDSPPPGRAGAGGDDTSWFRHMDRNRDGDVSPREFLGTADDFRKLDADGDGLIDAREAARGPSRGTGR